MYVYGMMDQWWIQFLKHCNYVVRSECQVRLKRANFYPVYKKEKMYMGLLVIYFSFVKWSKKLKIPVTEKSKIFQNSYISRHLVIFTVYKCMVWSIIQTTCLILPQNQAFGYKEVTKQPLGNSTA